MKKLLLLVAAVASISMISCSKSEQSTSASASTSANTESSVSAEAQSGEMTADNFKTQLENVIKNKDQAGLQKLLLDAQTTMSKLATTDQKAAQEFATKYAEALKENMEGLKGLVPEIEQMANAMQNMPAGATEAATNEAQKAVDNAKEKANEAANKAKESVENAKEEAKDKAMNAIKGM